MVSNDSGQPAGGPDLEALVGRFKILGFTRAAGNY